MKLQYPADQIQNPLPILRKAGYQPFTDPVTQKESFILRLTNGYYPRFHLYLKDEGGQIIFDLHLDQKKPSYKGTRAHGGEYEGPTVEREINRIASWVSHETGHPGHGDTESRKQATEDGSPDHDQNSSDESGTSNSLFGGIFR